MFTRAKKILSSELMYALDMDEEEAEEYLDELLEDTNEERAGGELAVAEALLAAATGSPAAGSGERLGGGRPRRSSSSAGPADGRLVAVGAGRRPATSTPS